jgi:hypothetical protein
VQEGGLGNEILIASSYALMIAIKFCGVISALSPLHKLILKEQIPGHPRAMSPKASQVDSIDRIN